MKAVWHAIAQCYVKEPLFYLFSEKTERGVNQTEER